MSEEVFHLGVKALIRNQAGKILLLRVNPEELHGDRQSHWDLPGGRVQVGEPVEATLRREVAEETGITQLAIEKPMGMVLSNIRIPNGPAASYGLILSVYECSVPEGSPVELSFEHTAFDWVTVARAAKLLEFKYPPEFRALLH